MAMKWFRMPFGSLLKKEDGRGRRILSDSEAVCEVPVPVLFCPLKSPGRNPDFALMLSISGGSCGQAQLPKPRWHVWQRAGQLQCIQSGQKPKDQVRQLLR